MERKIMDYLVFINHRGSDTKKNLASLIYHRLRSSGISVFLDYKEMRPGNTLCATIREAIDSAHVHIAIFSQNYAQSAWCLNELNWIMNKFPECVVLPIFYDVEPADLRRIDWGTYAQAFEKHRQRVSRNVVEQWEKSLGKAADISGLLFKTKDSDYGEFVEEIGTFVQEIVRERVRERKMCALEVATLPDGLGLDQTQKVVVNAGIGENEKTTLPNRIFKWRRSKIKIDLTSFQRQLLRDLGFQGYIANTHNGKSILRNSLQGLKVLIILDDVNDEEKIKSLLFITSCGGNW